MEIMQVLPFLTPINYMANRKKRSRSSDHDFESNYFKKRLISSSHFPTTPPSQDDEQQFYNNTVYEDSNYFFTNEAVKGYVTPSEKQVETIDDRDDYDQQNQVSLSKYSQDPQIQVLDVKGTALSDNIRYYIPNFVLKDQLPIPLQTTTLTEQSGQLILYRPPKTLLPLSPSTSATYFQSSSNEEEDTDDTFEAMDLD